MREIKFRAWDKRKKVMLYNVAVYNGGETAGIGVDEALEYYGSEENLPDEQGDEWVFLTDCELMQYIGFKDKAGEEIYEGDIYDLGMGIAVLRSECLVEDVCHLKKMLDDNAVVEIIGNIYEHPHLLTNKLNKTLSGDKK